MHIHHEDEDHVQASVGGLFMLHARGGATRENIERLVDNFDRFARTRSGPLGLLFQFTGNARPPEEADRQRIRDMVNRHAERLAGLSVCMPAAGFAGAAMRSVVSAVFVINRPRYPVKVFRDMAEAQAWLCDRTGLPLTTIASLSNYGATRITASDWS